MRKTKLALVVILLCIMPMTLVHAQRMAGSLAFFGFGGIGLPLSPEDFTDYWKLSIGFGGGIQYNLSDMMALNASFTYLPFKLDDDAFIDLITNGQPVPAGTEVEIEGFDIVCSIISANFMFYLTPPDASLGFYLTGGGGYYMFSVTDMNAKVIQNGQTVYEEDMEAGEVDDHFGVNGGVGLEFLLGTNMFLFAEGKYHYVFGEEDFAEEAGTMSFITAMAGLKISL